MRQMKKKIAVIGSGMAGLTSAWLCKKAGAEVTILEARKNRGMDSYTQFLNAKGEELEYVDVPLRVMSPHAWPTVLDMCEKLGVSQSHYSKIENGEYDPSKHLRQLSKIFVKVCSGQTDAILLGYSKAFDKVDHRLLLSKMNHLGICGPLLKWASSFLSNRLQHVVVDGCISGANNVLSGVPQGTVLGPLFFLIYINDIAENLSLGTSI